METKITQRSSRTEDIAKALTFCEQHLSQTEQYGSNNIQYARALQIVRENILPALKRIFPDEEDYYKKVTYMLRFISEPCRNRVEFGFPSGIECGETSISPIFKQYYTDDQTDVEEKTNQCILNAQNCVKDLEARLTAK